MPLECCGQFFRSSNGSVVSSIQEVSAGREMSTLAQTNGTRSANLDVSSRPSRRGAGKSLCRFMGPSHGGSNSNNPSHFLSFVGR